MLQSRFPLNPLLLLTLAQCSFTLAQSTDEQPKQRPPILPYTPSKGAAGVMGAVYLLTAIGFVVWSRRHKGRYMLAFTIGAGFYALGLFLRISVAGKPSSIFRFAIMNMMIVLSPCAFIAGIYMLLGRLAVHLDATEHLSINQQKLTKIFVTSDVVTFFIQGGGGGLGAAQDTNLRNIGSKIFLVGLIAQLISFLIYTYVFVVFVYRVRKHLRSEWDHRPHGFNRHWLSVVVSMAISCAFIIIRSVFRTVENGEVREGPLASNEAYFYILDCLAIWLSIAVYLNTWPPKYLTNYSPASKDTIAMNPSSSVTKV